MITQEKADYLRQDVMRVACKNNKGHIAPSLSCLDILTVLYYTPEFKKDRVILSKGHGCYGLYAIWKDLRQMSPEKWEEFKLPGCLDGFGSLGHGLPIAVGLAYGIKNHVFCIVGDGEMQEGSMWEALSFLKHHNLKNITVVVDYNGLQAMDEIKRVLSQNLYERFRGWGFEPLICDGHNHGELRKALIKKSSILIAYTKKGFGFKCMEGKPEFHYRVPTDNEK